MITTLKRLAYGETRYAAVLVGLLLGCVLGAIQAMGMFTVPDGVLYDLFVKRGHAPTHEQPKVLLLDTQADMRDGDDKVWLPLLKELQSQGAEQILFTFFPPHVTRNFYAYAHDAGNIFFGRTLVQTNGVTSESLEWETLPAFAQDQDVLTAAYALSSSTYGVYRVHSHAFVSSNQTEVGALESLAAAHAKKSPGKGWLRDPYLINFLGEYDLPRISAARAAKGELIPELVKGRSILIGMTSGGARLYTPLASAGKMLSELEFHGYALDTLLQDQVIRTVPGWVNFTVVLILIAASLFILQWGGLRFSAGVTTLLMVIYGVVAWVSLDYALVWLPLTEFWLAQIAIFLVFTRVRAVNEEARLRQILLETNAKLREHFFPSSFSASHEHWSQVITMVNQTLNLERVIFLERVKDDHRVREIVSLNCTLEDIREVRRDYEREPYSTAIAERLPIEVRDYLTHGKEDDGEVQYLVPLLFSGEVLGFWAFGVRPEKLAALHNKDAVLRDFGEQIAELLFHRQQWLEKEAELSRPLARYLKLQGGEQVVESLEKTLTALDRRLAGMEDYLDGLSTAGILYDLFGSVLIANQKMVQLLSEAKLAPYQMTAVDLISALAGVSLDYARGLMQAITIDRQKISLAATLTGDERSYVLYLGPLLPGPEDQKIRTGDPLPFELKGVLCELIDVTTIKRLSNLKITVAERLTYQVRNDTESLLAAVSLLEKPVLADDKRERVLHIVRDKIDSLVTVTEKVYGLLNQDINSEASERYPVDCKQPLSDAIAALKSKADAHAIKFDLHTPELISLVFASPDGLQEVLESFLEVLITDTVQHGNIRVDLSEDGHWIVYRFANQGFGIPEERLQHYLHGEASLSTEEFRKLRASFNRVTYWDGTLEGHSEIGVGTRFELKLKGFI